MSIGSLESRIARIEQLADPIARQHGMRSQVKYSMERDEVLVRMMVPTGATFDDGECACWFALDGEVLIAPASEDQFRELIRHEVAACIRTHLHSKVTP